jgi:hypothetical protein
MAQFPKNPKIGQSFLPPDEDVIYVWNGFSWEKGDLGGESDGSPNLDGGTASSIYGGVSPINGGDA